LGANRRLQGSEGGPNGSEQVRRGPGGPSGSEGVRAGPSRSIKIGRGNQTGNVERLRVALKGGLGRVRRACAKRYPVVRAVRSESDGGEIRPRENRWLWAASLLSAAVRSPELRQARARVAPGSPELGRGEEGATVNSMAGKRP
jgi:hypothetical protein